MKSILALSPAKKTAICGLALGACIGLFAVFLITQFVFSEQPRETDEHRQFDTAVKQIERGSNRQEVETARELLQILKLNDDSLPVFERFSEESLVGIADFISETKQLDYPVSSQSLTSLLIRELTRINPDATLDLVPHWTLSDGQDFVRMVFEEWSDTDLSAALQATEQLRASQWQTAIRAILRTQPNQSHRVEEYAKAQGMENKLVSLIEENEILELLNQRPEEAWYAVLDDDVSNGLQKDLITEVLNTWISQDGYQVLDRIYEFRHKIDRFRLREILSEVVQHHPEEAFRHIVTLQKEKRDWLLPIVLETWAKRDPEAAYYALESVEKFSGRFLSSTIVSDWARSDPVSVLQKLESLPRSLREDAATAAMSELTSQDPQTAMEFLSNWKEILGVDGRNLEKVFVKDWARQNPEEALTWVQENVDEAHPILADMVKDVVLNIAPDDPERALEIALSQPSRSIFTQVYFESLVRTLGTLGHIDLVMSILDQIPKAAELGTFSAIAWHFVGDERWEDAVQLTASVPEDLQTWYFKRLAFHGIQNNVHTLIEKLDTFPSSEMRTTMAREILRWHEDVQSIVSDDQVKHLRSIVADSNLIQADD
ncbi:MAG: hypothetical protein F4W92_08760 [Gammaproteobacteria bacterium]|nr:hypothetical protein [Gammaproteobacteria bacterium]